MGAIEGAIIAAAFTSRKRIAGAAHDGGRRVRGAVS